MGDFEGEGFFGFQVELGGVEAGFRGPCVVAVPVIGSPERKLAVSLRSKPWNVPSGIFRRMGLRWSCGRFFSGVGAEVDCAELAGGAGPGSVIPGAEDEEDFVVFVVGFEGGVLGLGAPHVFLVPVAAYFEGGDFYLVQVLFDCHVLPELGVIGVGEEAGGGGELVHVGGFGGSGEVDVAEEEVVGVFLGFDADVGFLGFELLGVVEAIGFAEGSVVEEVVA